MRNLLCFCEKLERVMEFDWVDFGCLDAKFGLTLIFN